MTAHTLHLAECRTAFPPESFLSYETIETLIRDACHNSGTQAATILEGLAAIGCGTGDEESVSLTVWCSGCGRHRECCTCRRTILDNLRVPTEQLGKLAPELEREVIAFPPNTHRLALSIANRFRKRW